MRSCANASEKGLKPLDENPPTVQDTAVAHNRRSEGLAVKINWLFIVALVLAWFTVSRLGISHRFEYEAATAIAVACVYRIILVYVEITVAGLKELHRERDPTPPHA